MNSTDRILLVEDDRFFRELFAGLLQDAGYAIDLACSGEEALELLQHQSYALVVTDLVMSGVSGLDLLARIKSTDPSIDVILVTGNANLESAVFALKHGARDYLVKPVNSDELLHSVRLCMEQRRLLNENDALRNMVALLQVSQALAGSLDVEGICRLALDALTREVGVSRGIALLYDDGILHCQDCRALEHATGSLVAERLSASLRSGASRGVQPYRVALPISDQVLAAEGLREVLVVPLIVNHQMLGLVALLNDPAVPLPVSQQDRNIVFLQDQVARALDNALRYTAARDLLYIDELSGLFNYRYLKVALEREIKRADRYQTQLTVMFLDLDNFKSINDTYGHMVGSSLLRELGEQLKRSVREVDVLIRYGGDEYTIILVETSAEVAVRVGERIRRTIADTPFLAREGYQIKLTASIGYACYPEDTTSVQELLMMADRAMYAGKAAGKNCIYRVGAAAPDACTSQKEQQ